MRFKYKKPLCKGDQRVRKVFAWLPKLLSSPDTAENYAHPSEWVWLETLYSQERVEESGGDYNVLRWYPFMYTTTSRVIKEFCPGGWYAEEVKSCPR